VLNRQCRYSNEKFKVYLQILKKKTNELNIQITFKNITKCTDLNSSIQSPVELK